MREPVEGYEVITSDDGKLGEVVAVEGDLLVVEGGMLRKSRHAVPKAFAHADDGERVVRLTVSKELVEDSPAVKDGELDHRAIAAHYGLAAGYDDPETKGYGELTPDDPAWSAEQEELRSGVEPAAERRARILQGESEAGLRGRPIIPPDPHEGP
ncbi:MAG: hypothetical protein QOG06_2384 [Gaiellaceae bacterium]|jgi:hypothetical protein|nr:hypothetical protein [Gaiellaceae bacterium]